MNLQQILAVLSQVSDPISATLRERETQQSLYHETQGRKPETSSSQTSSASHPQISPPLSPQDTTDLGTQKRRPEPASHKYRNNISVIPMESTLI